ncbi:hypothetical protein LBMAG53_27830 [Planctomycetota bacterium]|nr:hypothetical protein LBMAG53_27830 [Planctomycetota bacterium]
MIWLLYAACAGFLTLFLIAPVAIAMQVACGHLLSRLLPLLFIAALWSEDGPAEAKHQQLIGHYTQILGKDGLVLYQTIDNVTILSLNGKMGRVQYPNGMARDSGFRWENEMIPGAHGIVVNICGPFDLSGAQHPWSDGRDDQSFERAILVDGKVMIGVACSFGPQSDKNLVDALYEVMRTGARP